jgi:polyisoprenoid-binding protein YceI
MRYCFLRGSARTLVVTFGVLAAGCASQGAPAASAPADQRAAAPAPASATIAAAPIETAAAEGLRLTLRPGASEARYRAREQLAGNTLFTEAVGRTTAVDGQVVVTAALNVVRDESRVTVDLTTLQSDQPQRDNYLQRTTLETAQFRTVQLVPTEARGLPAQLPTAGDVAFQLVGDLTVKDVTRPTVWDVQARIAGPEVSGTATTQFTLADFNLPKPSVARVLSIEDTIRLELDFQGTTAPAPDVSGAAGLAILQATGPAPG